MKTQQRAEAKQLSALKEQGRMSVREGNKDGKVKTSSTAATDTAAELIRYLVQTAPSFRKADALKQVGV